MSEGEAFKIISCLRNTRDELNDFSRAEESTANIYSAGDFFAFRFFGHPKNGIIHQGKKCTEVVVN